MPREESFRRTMAQDAKRGTRWIWKWKERDGGTRGHLDERANVCSTINQNNSKEEEEEKKMKKKLKKKLKKKKLKKSKEKTQKKAPMNNKEEKKKKGI